LFTISSEIYAFEIREDLFSYSLHWKNKECRIPSEKVKRGLVQGLNQGFKGLKIIKQDLSSGVTVLNDPFRKGKATVYFREKQACEKIVSELYKKRFMSWRAREW